MITKNPMQLKAFIKNKAAEKNVSAQLVMQNYMMERLLERISLSKYSHNFILKGGFLISAIVGLDSRTTMDIDTTMKGLILTHDSIKLIFSGICNIPVDDDITFEIVSIVDIREVDDYPGIRINLKANYNPIRVPLSVDITTGDKITPREVEYKFKLLFEEREIPIMAYNLETILAEKIETVLSRGIANTRPRDFYDIHIIYSLQGTKCNPATLRKALEQTSAKRGSIDAISDYKVILEKISSNAQMMGFWQKYQRDFDYAKDISFKMACDTIIQIMTWI